MGTVKWFDDDRGYGFIAQDEGGELFVHLTGLIVEGYDRLLEGTPVEYEIERTARGPQAVDVVPLA
jgi:CspA family cold shock protein